MDERYDNPADNSTRTFTIEVYVNGAANDDEQADAIEAALRNNPDIFYKFV